MSRSCYSAAERQVVEEYPKAAKPQPDRRVTIHRIKRALPASIAIAVRPLSIFRLTDEYGACFSCGHTDS
jgi:hypothetical protein